VPHGVLEYAPELLEAALLHALQGSPEASAFHQQRDPLYEIADPEAREASFRALHTAWFVRLRLGQVIEQALQEYPLIVQQVQGCKVLRARSARDEGAELFVAAARRWVVLRLRPERLATPECLLTFLRHELLHIVDMLDPAFGYQPVLSPSADEPGHVHILRERYRVLWDTSIDGRLVRLGLAPPACRAHRFREFAQTFPMLGDRSAEAFARFFEGAAVTHAELVQGACAPDAMLGHLSGLPHRGERCPPCRFPTHAFEPEPIQLGSAVLQRIGVDFPSWEPGQGMCQQCAEMYRARASP